MNPLNLFLISCTLSLIFYSKPTLAGHWYDPDSQDDSQEEGEPQTTTPYPLPTLPPHYKPPRGSKIPVELFDEVINENEEQEGGVTEDPTTDTGPQEVPPEPPRTPEDPQPRRIPKQSRKSFLHYTSPPQLKPPTIFLPPPPDPNTKRRSNRHNSKHNRIQQQDFLIPYGDICDPTDPLYSRCTPNANCVLFENENLYRCNCSYSYEPTSTKKCLRAYGYYCDSKDGCNSESFLTCVDNRCECENSKVYQEGEEGCRSRVGGPCNTAGGPECVENAVCLSFDRFGRHSRCLCRDNYVETSLGLCLPGPGMPCHGANECNPEIPLVCKEGICSCRESVQIYDPEQNQCVGLVGAQCCLNFDGLDCPNNITNACVNGAFCKKTRRTLPGRCVCQSYNLETDERGCGPNPGFSQITG